MITFGIGTGCQGADTYKVEIMLPEGLETVRAMPSPGFGSLEITRDEAGQPTRVTFWKDTVRDTDEMYYQVALGILVPNAPFSKLEFPTTQYCRSESGEEIVKYWHAVDEVQRGQAPMAVDAEVLPAPSVTLVPMSTPGWNRFTLPVTLTDLSVFSSAEIVWLGEDAAYSANASVREMIEADEGLQLLEELPEGAEIWVKY